MANQKSKAITGWIAFLDIFAFSGMLSESKISQTVDRLSNFYNCIRQIISIFNSRNHRDVVYFRIFSDTVVIWMDSLRQSRENFALFLEIISSIVQEAPRHGFIFRGAASFGDILVDKDYVNGSAYLRAYRNESNLIMDATVLITADELRNAGLFSYYANVIVQHLCKNNKTVDAMTVPTASWDQLVEIATHQAADCSEEQRAIWERLHNYAMRLKDANAHKDN